MPERERAFRYPRPGERIAPVTLREVLLDRVPRDLAGPRGAGLRLADLDESTWKKFPVEVIESLSRLVIARVGSPGARRLLEDRHFPRPPEGLRLHQLHVEHRTRYCLEREGLDEEPSRLGDLTIGGVLAIRSFGPRCLVDLLCALESAAARRGRLSRALTAEAERLAELPEAESARHDDPRFGPLIEEVDAAAVSARHLADRLLSRDEDPPDAAYVVERVRQLRERILALPLGTVEEELKQIFASTPHGRNREIVIAYYGWADGQRHTLAEIGARYHMTRERTRQICAKLVRRPSPARIPAPVLDRALGFIEKRLPRGASELERELREAGLTAIDLRLENVEIAAGLLGRRAPFRIVACGSGRVAAPPAQADVPPAVVELARKEIYYHGATTVARLVELLGERFPGRVDPRIVEESLPLIDGFRWLDRDSGWFHLTTVWKHGLPKAVEKALSVAGRLRAAELATAVNRNRRIWKTTPPARVIAAFCQRQAGVKVERDWIAADPPRDWKDVLTGVEAQLVEVLKERGPIMERGALEELCVARGMNRFSFQAFLAASPVIAQYGPSVYGLVGASISPGSVKALAAQRRAAGAPARVLQRYGMTPDGRIWLSYRLSRAASTYAVITVPTAWKHQVQGKFELVDAEGRPVGVLAAKDGRAWGLGAYLRRRGVSVHDAIVVTLDLDKRQAVIALDKNSTPCTK